jgi:hypothetical protein
MAVGQDCGGPWDYHGTCADDLYCDKSSDPHFTISTGFNFNLKGICTPKNYKDDFCCDRKVVKETGEVYTLDMASYRKALDICLDSCVYLKEGDESGTVFCFMQGSIEYYADVCQ